ncbi:MAG: glutathione ABC transporter permease GsiC, partial [Deltaproteobacteria bacterium CG_4_10_14_0_2_um_filter_43_8]
LGLHKPLHEQYFDFLGGLVTGDWGRSLYDHKTVLAHIGSRFMATISLSFSALLVALFISLPLGILAAVKKGKCADSAAMFFSLLGISIPNFWLGPLLIIVFSLWLSWFPISGREGFASFVLPSITLGTALAAMLSRMIRSTMLSEMKKDYVTTARAKGVSERRILYKHILRNALNPIVTIVGLQLGALFAGAIITEKVFAWPGLGTLLLDAINRRDYPVVQGTILVISFLYVFINAITDCFYKVIDPRVNL